MLRELKEIKKVMNKMRIPVERNYKKEPKNFEAESYNNKIFTGGLEQQIWASKRTHQQVEDRTVEVIVSKKAK